MRNRSPPPLIVLILLTLSILDCCRCRNLVANTLADEQVLSSEEEASLNVDALVNDNVFDSQCETVPSSVKTLDQSQHAIPTVPPGFSIPAVPRALPSDQPQRPLSRNTSTVTPAIPIVPTMASPGTAFSKAKKQKYTIEAVEDSSFEAANVSRPTTPVKAGRKTSTKASAIIETPKKKLAEAPVVEQKEIKQASPSPIKATPRSKAAATKKGQASADASPQKDGKDAFTTPTTPATSKRQHPGKLDIAAATKSSENEQPSASSSTKADAQPKPTRAVSANAAGSVPASPAATSTGSPIKKTTGARTLRVVATPKTEVPPPLSAVSVYHPQLPAVGKLRSRQASIASLNQPGTPASDLISDTASITSTSISRANSPPPNGGAAPIGGKVGTAPVRKKTKSQQKKDRQEKARQAEEERAIAMDEHKSEPEIVQAPIIGRKKKAKKPAANPKPSATVAKSQTELVKEADAEEVKEQGDLNEASAIPSKKDTIKTSISSTHIESASPPEQSKEKRDPTAQSVIADLQRTGELIANTLEFFKPLSSSLAHASRSTQASGGPVAPPDLKIHFTEADLDALAKKKAVRVNSHDGRTDSRTLISPQGKFFWGLTQELEERALELERNIEGLKGVARFHPRKNLHNQHHQHNESQTQPRDMLPALATALKEAGAKLSKNAGQPVPNLDAASTLLGSSSLPLPPVQSPSELPPPQQPQQQQTPADAGAYLNQFVLPKTDDLPAARSEMAAVGGPPGSGTANMSVNVNKIAKAAKAIAEGGAVGTELEGMGVIAADLLGGVFVQGLEALVGAGLGLSSSGQDLSLDSNGNVSGLDVQGLVNAYEASGGLSGSAGRRGRRSVLTVDEAEQAMLAAKKDHEALEKKLSVLMKRNKKMLNGMGKA